MKVRVSVAIPTYNEKDNLQILIPILMEVFEANDIDGRVIIIDGGSTDGTVVAAKKLMERYGRMSMIRHPSKLGIGLAYKDGFRCALSLGSDGIVEMDADLSHNPIFIPKFIERMEEGYDLVIGSRYTIGGGAQNWSFGRRLISMGAVHMARSLLGLRTRDVTSGFRAYTSEALDEIRFADVKSDGYAFQVEMVMRCERAGLRVCEIPIIFSNRRFGRSKLGIRDIWSFFRTVLDLSMHPSL
ncbi:MAG: polyprenol monophosphomannose synthase [Candidatus Bathyarchaeia archaeon]